MMRMTDDVDPPEAQPNASNSPTTGVKPVAVSLADKPFITGLRDSRPAWLVKWAWTIVAIVIVTLAGYWVFTRVRFLLTILLTSLFISFALEPAVNKLARRGWRRGLATAVVFGAFLVVVVALVPAIVWLLVTEGEVLADQFNTWVGSINELLDKYGIHEQIGGNLVREALGKINVSSLSTVLGLAESFIGAVVQIFMIFLFTIYFMADGPKLRRTIAARLKPGRQRSVLDVWEISIEKTWGYFYSRAIVAVVAAFAVGVSMLIVSFVPESHPEFRLMAIPVAILYGIFDAFLPIIGAYIGAVFPIFVVIVTGDVVGAIILLVLILVYKQFEDYWISPRVAAHTMQIHPAIAIGSVVAGTEILGITGALLALPVAAIIQAFLSTYLDRHKLIDSDLIDTQAKVHVAKERHHRFGRWSKETADTRLDLEEADDKD